MRAVCVSSTALDLCSQTWFAFMHGPTHPMIHLDESATTVNRLPPRPLLSHMLTFESEAFGQVTEVSAEQYEERLEKRMHRAFTQQRSIGEQEVLDAEHGRDHAPPRLDRTSAGAAWHDVLEHKAKAFLVGGMRDEAVRRGARS